MQAPTAIASRPPRPTDGLARSAQEATLRLVGDCRTIPDIATLRSAMADWAKSLGFETYSYLRIRREGATARFDTASLINTYDPSWTDYYLDRGFDRIDPNFRAAIARGHASRWSRRLAPGRLSARQRELCAAAIEHGLAEGVAVPVHDPAGPLAIAVLIADAPAHDVDALFAAAAVPIQLAVTQFHLAAVALDPRRAAEPAGAPAAPADAATSPRERQCAALLASGRTVREIAAGLGIAERTVVFHLDNLKRKLGARSRTETVARLARAGLLEDARTPAAP